MKLIFEPFAAESSSAEYAIFLLGAVLVSGVAIDIFLLCSGRLRLLTFNSFIKNSAPLPWTWKDSGILVWAYIFVLILVGTIFGLPCMSTLENSGFGLITRAAILPVTQITVFYLLIRAKNISFSKALCPAPCRVSRDIFRGLVFYLAVMPAVSLSGIVYAVFLKETGYPVTEGQEILVMILDPGHSAGVQLCLGLTATALAPVSEELVFRGVFIPGLLKHSRPWPAICLVSLIFASMHAYIPALLPLFVIAVAFALGYLYTGSILVPIFMHIFFNTVNLTAALLLSNAGA